MKVEYKSICNTWTNGMEKHGTALLQAVAATIQYKMDHESELFPIMVEGLMFASRAVNKLV
jgi:hypothetical protein